MQTSRKSIVAEIINLVKNFKNEGAELYIYKGFEGTNGHICIELEPFENNRLNIVGEFMDNGFYDEDYLFIHHMRTRSLLAIRNALFREYGKRKFRGKH